MPVAHAVALSAVDQSVQPTTAWVVGVSAVAACA